MQVQTIGFVMIVVKDFNKRTLAETFAQLVNGCTE